MCIGNFRVTTKKLKKRSLTNLLRKKIRNHTECSKNHIKLKPTKARKRVESKHRNNRKKEQGQQIEKVITMVDTNPTVSVITLLMISMHQLTVYCL